MSQSSKRLGLCVGAWILLFIYVSAATNFGLKFYLPIGLLLMSAYCWFVITKAKKAYPISTTAIEQLGTTFLIIVLFNSFQINNMLTRIKQEEKNLSYSHITSLAESKAQLTITGLMCLGLLITYIVLKIAKRKEIKKPNGEKV